MTLSKRITLCKWKVISETGRRIEKLPKNSCRLENQEVSGTVQFDEVKGRILDLTVEICEGVFDEFCIELAHN